MGNIPRAMGPGAAVLDIPFGGLTTTRNNLYERRDMDLCGVANTAQIILLY